MTKTYCIVLNSFINFHQMVKEIWPEFKKKLKRINYFYRLLFSLLALVSFLFYPRVWSAQLVGIQLPGWFRTERQHWDPIPEGFHTKQIGLGWEVGCVVQPETEGRAGPAGLAEWAALGLMAAGTLHWWWGFVAMAKRMPMRREWPKHRRWGHYWKKPERW